eukprot:CAMPEP_0172458594 /NCGR_PEP_ID=MMETSP1065-20121228/28321_1 /TAXON_ID=265537 /ORGANISM="Amphiprora paludosa, Strain CCMP125" /LENGTH=939 /DNA_ID=CAMNT_0013212933 /DNA_START=46 /DNA_END=2865 /DNA_ORIENTATION=-
MTGNDQIEDAEHQQQLSYDADEEIPTATFSQDSDDPPGDHYFEAPPSQPVDDDHHQMPTDMYSSVHTGVSDTSPPGVMLGPSFEDDLDSMEEGMASSDSDVDEWADAHHQYMSPEPVTHSMEEVMTIPEGEEWNGPEFDSPPSVQQTGTSATFFSSPSSDTEATHPETPDTERSTPPSTPEELPYRKSYASRGGYELKRVPYGRGDSSVAFTVLTDHGDDSVYYANSTTKPKKQEKAPIASPQTAGIGPWTKMLMVVAAALLVVALVGVGLWSYSQVTDLNGEIDDYETRVSLLGANSSSWHDTALRFEAKSEDLENQVASLQSQLDAMQLKVNGLESGNAGLMSEKSDLLTDKANLENQVAVLEGTVQNLEDKNEEWAGLHAQMEQSVLDLQGLNENLSNTGNLLQGQIASMEANLASLTAELEGLSDENSLLTGNLNSTRLTLLEEIQRFTDAVNLLEGQNSELQNLTEALSDEKEMLNSYTIPSLNTRIASLEAQLDTMTENRDSLSSDLSVCQTNVFQLSEEKAQLEAEKASCELNLSDCQDQSANLTSTLATCNSDLSLCQSARSQCSVDLGDMTQNRDQCEGENTGFRATILGMTGDIERLENEIDRLEEETARLGGEVNRLEGEVDDFEVLTGQLNQTVLELEDLSDTLNNTKIELEGQVANLESNIVELQGVRDDLIFQNGQSQIMIQDLNSTKNDLTDQVSTLDTIVEDLEAQNAELDRIKNELSNQVDNLETVKAGLEQDVDNLEVEVEDFNSEVNRLNVLLAELNSVSAYINNTAASLQQEYTTIVDELDRKIALNRKLAMDSLRNNYKDATDFWDCAIGDKFGGSPWLSDQNIPIGSDDLPLVLDEVETRVLDQLCLSRADYETYMSATFGGLSTLTYNNVLVGTSIYSGDARRYYFPFEGQEGLTPEQWEAASYSCETVPPFSLST